MKDNFVWKLVRCIESGPDIKPQAWFSLRHPPVTGTWHSRRHLSAAGRRAHCLSRPRVCAQHVPSASPDSRVDPDAFTGGAAPSVATPDAHSRHAGRAAEAADAAGRAERTCPPSVGAPAGREGRRARVPRGWRPLGGSWQSTPLHLLAAH